MSSCAGNTCACGRRPGALHQLHARGWCGIMQYCHCSDDGSIAAQRRHHVLGTSTWKLQTRQWSAPPRPLLVEVALSCGDTMEKVRQCDVRCLQIGMLHGR